MTTFETIPLAGDFTHLVAYQLATGKYLAASVSKGDTALDFTLKNWE